MIPAAPTIPERVHCAQESWRGEGCRGCPRGQPQLSCPQDARGLSTAVPLRWPVRAHPSSASGHGLCPAPQVLTTAISVDEEGAGTPAEAHSWRKREGETPKGGGRTRQQEE